MAIREKIKAVGSAFEKNPPESGLDEAREMFRDFSESVKNQKNGRALPSLLAKWAGALDVHVGVFS